MAKQQPKLPGAKPTHRIFVVTGEGKTAKWLELGAAWPHGDGSGFSITCTAIPLQGRIVMRAITERETQQAASAG
ncbi:MAG: hypothetical protein ABI810_21910 [Sphingomonas bacterium]